MKLDIPGRHFHVPKNLSDLRQTCLVVATVLAQMVAYKVRRLWLMGPLNSRVLYTLNQDAYVSKVT